MTKHIALADYDMPEIGGEMPTLEQELAAIPERNVPSSKHARQIDCPDCGRTVAIQGRCRKCGGDSWRPAGYVDIVGRVRELRAAEWIEEDNP